MTNLTLTADLKRYEAPSISQSDTTRIQRSGLVARDCFDMPITGADDIVIDAYNDYVFQFLGYGSNLRALFPVTDQYPDCALINAHAAVLHMAFEGLEGWQAAKPYLDAMRLARKGGVTEREGLFCDAVEAWYVRDFYSSLDFLNLLTVRWPADLCAIKWGQYHAFNLGDQEALLRFGQRAILAHKGTPYAHGLVAFGLEQNHRLDEAEEEGKYAVEVALDDAWAHHAVAHVLETKGRISEGIRWMKHCSHTWDQKGVFIRDHNWWHTALFYLGADEHEKVIEIYDERLWGAWPEFPQEQIGAVSLLWRLEMFGAKVGERWNPVVDQVRARAEEHILPFHDLHYVYALARAGNHQEADQFLDDLGEFAEKQTDRSAPTWQNVCVPLAHGVAAFARNQPEKTVNYIQPILGDIQYIGGSHAQRQVFIDTYEAARSSL